MILVLMISKSVLSIDYKVQSKEKDEKFLTLQARLFSCWIIFQGAILRVQFNYVIIGDLTMKIGPTIIGII